MKNTGAWTKKFSLKSSKTNQITYVMDCEVDEWQLQEIVDATEFPIPLRIVGREIGVVKSAQVIDKWFIAQGVMTSVGLDRLASNLVYPVIVFRPGAGGNVWHPSLVYFDLSGSFFVEPEENSEAKEV